MILIKTLNISFTLISLISTVLVDAQTVQIQYFIIE